MLDPTGRRARPRAPWTCTLEFSDAGERRAVVRVGPQRLTGLRIDPALGALSVTLRRVQESRDPAARRPDLSGQLTLTAGLFLLVLALLRSTDDGWSSARTIGELAGAALLLGAFLMIERRSRQPMLPLSLFRAPAFTGAQLSALAISASFFALYLYATLYLQDVLGLSAIDAGLAYLPGTLTIFVVSGASASLGDRIAPGG